MGGIYFNSQNVWFPAKQRQRMLKCSYCGLKVSAKPTGSDLCCVLFLFITSCFTVLLQCCECSFYEAQTAVRSLINFKTSGKVNIL